MLLACVGNCPKTATDVLTRAVLPLLFRTRLHRAQRHACGLGRRHILPGHCRRVSTQNTRAASFFLQANMQASKQANKERRAALESQCERILCRLGTCRGGAIHLLDAATKRVLLSQVGCTPTSAMHPHVLVSQPFHCDLNPCLHV